MNFTVAQLKLLFEGREGFGVVCTVCGDEVLLTPDNADFFDRTVAGWRCPECREARKGLSPGKLDYLGVRRKGPAWWRPNGEDDSEWQDRDEDTHTRFRMA